MKAWMWAGLFTVAMAPMAAAAENDVECQLDETRRVTQERADAAPAPASVTGIARPAVAQRDVAEAPRAEPRRRTGKRIPDAELIGPRSTL